MIVETRQKETVLYFEKNLFADKKIVLLFRSLSLAFNSALNKALRQRQTKIKEVKKLRKIDVKPSNYKNEDKMDGEF